MRYIARVAQREYAENAATKGFWIGLFLFPVLIVGSIYAQRFLEKATPTRHFVLVDQSGQFESIVQKGLERLYARDVAGAMKDYAEKHAVAPAEGQEIDLESIPAIDPNEIFQQMEDAVPGAMEGMAQLDPALITAQMKSQGAIRDDAPEFELPKRKYQRVPLPSGLDANSDPAELSESLRPWLRGNKKLPASADGEAAELFAAVIIPADIEQTIQRPGIESLMNLAEGGSTRKGIQYWSSNLADDQLRDEIEDVVNDEIRRREYERLQVDPGVVETVQKTRVPFAKLNPKKEVGKEEVSVADQIRQWAPVGFVYLLWIGIFTISQMLLNNTIEEKSNRIIEVLLSSVTARELMLGKLFGIAGIGITMLLVWIGSLVGILYFMKGPEAQFVSALFDVVVSSDLLPTFVVYFLLGYLMYSGLFLAIGSVCNTLKEAQNLMGPIMVVMIVPLITMMFIPKDPNGTLATVLSWIPLYTPFVMMNRAAADPPLFDQVGTLILLVATTGLMLWLTGKIFRIGILRSGQPPKILELFRWVRA